MTAIAILTGVVDRVPAIRSRCFWPVQSGAVPCLRGVQGLALLTLLAARVTALGAASTWARPQGRVWRPVGRKGFALSRGLIGDVAVAFNVLSPSMAI